MSLENADIRMGAEKKYDNPRKNYPGHERHFRTLPVYHYGASSFAANRLIKMNTSKMRQVGQRRKGTEVRTRTRFIYATPPGMRELGVSEWSSICLASALRFGQISTTTVA
jgi:hypothetical protein